LNNASGSILGNPIGPSLTSLPNMRTLDSDEEGSSGADDEDEDDDVEMDEEQEIFASLNHRASTISRASRESGAAGMYAPWGGVHLGSR